MYTPSSVVDRLCGIFHPVFTKWQEWAPQDTHLWESCVGKTEAQLMEEDVRRVGLHFASADNIGAKTEYALTAECIAHVRARGGMLAGSRKLMEVEIDTIYKGLTHTKNHEVKPPIDQDKPFHAPICWRITQAAAAAGRVSHTSLEAMLEAYIDLAHLFVLRDGNITPQEDIQMMRFHAAFDG